VAESALIRSAARASASSVSKWSTRARSVASASLNAVIAAQSASVFAVFVALV
jgi:hypothetical protein